MLSAPSPAIPTSPAFPQRRTGAFSAYLLQLLFVGGGIFGCFFAWSLVHERITARPYIVDGEERKFTAYVVTTLIVSAATAIVALLCSAVMGVVGKPVVWVPRCSWHLYATAGFTMTFASPISMQAAKNLSYPVYLAVTMGKMIPSVLMGRLLYGVRYSLLKYAAVVVVTIGVVGFSLLNQSRDGDAPESSATLTVDPVVVTSVLLAFVGMVLDGYTVSTQDEINRQVPTLSSLQLMYELGVAQAAWCVAALIIGEALPRALWTPVCQPEIADALHVFRHAPQALMDMLLFGLLNGCGRIFIMYGVRVFGGLTLVAIMSTRKVGSVFISIAVNGHAVSAAQWSALAAVVAGVVLDSVDGILKRRRDARRTTKTRPKTE